MSRQRKALLLPAIVLLAALCCAGIQAVRFLSGVFPIRTVPPRLGAGLPLGEGDAIAFSVMRVDVLRPFQLYIVDDADGIHPLSQGLRRSDTAPVWSPDGAQIVYQSVSGRATRYTLVDASGAARREIAADASHKTMLRWSPDGSRLAYLAYDQDAGGSIASSPHLCVTEVATGETQRAPAGDIQDLVWLPDGPSLLAIVRGDGGVTVELYDADGAHQRRLSGADYLRDASWMALSPDASHVAYVLPGPAGESEFPADSLTISTIDGSSTRSVGALWIEGPIVWSPDSRRIALVALTAGYEYALYVANADGTGLKELMLVNTGDESGEMIPAAPAWSPDGTRIAISSVDTPTQAAIMVLHADGSDPREIITLAGTGAMIYDLAWRPGP